MHDSRPLNVQQQAVSPDAIIQTSMVSHMPVVSILHAVCLVRNQIAAVYILLVVRFYIIAVRETLTSSNDPPSGGHARAIIH